MCYSCNGPFEIKIAASMSWSSLCPYREINENWFNPKMRPRIMKAIANSAETCGKENMKRVFPTLSNFKMELIVDGANGVKAMEDIPSNVFIMEYLGEVKIGTPTANNFRSIRLADQLYIDSEMTGNAGRLLRNTCDGNLRLERVWSGNMIRAFFRTTRPIKAGEDLTWNYFFEIGKGELNQLCHCKAKNCKFLKGSRKKKPQLSYICPIPECSKTFKSDYYLKRHTTSHCEEQNNFECTKCKTMFKYKDNMKRHQLLCKGKERNEKKFPCDACGKSFTRQDNVRSHKLKYCKGELRRDSVTDVDAAGPSTKLIEAGTDEIGIQKRTRRNRKVTTTGQKQAKDIDHDELRVDNGGPVSASKSSKSKDMVKVKATGKKGDSTKSLVVRKDIVSDDRRLITLKADSCGTGLSDVQRNVEIEKKSTRSKAKVGQLRKSLRKADGNDSSTRSKAKVGQLRKSLRKADGNDSSTRSKAKVGQLRKSEIDSADENFSEYMNRLSNGEPLANCDPVLNSSDQRKMGTRPRREVKRKLSATLVGRIKIPLLSDDNNQDNCTMEIFPLP